MLQLLATPEIGLFLKLKNGCFMQMAGLSAADKKVLDLPSDSVPERQKRPASRPAEDRPKKRRRRRHKQAEMAELHTPAQAAAFSLIVSASEALAIPDVLTLKDLGNMPSPRGMALGASRSAPDVMSMHCMDQSLPTTLPSRRLEASQSMLSVTGSTPATNLVRQSDVRKVDRRLKMNVL